VTTTLPLEIGIASTTQPVSQEVPVRNPTSPTLVDTGHESERNGRWAIFVILTGLIVTRVRRFAR
jgi:hypothetical protein